jgi:HNH endonuclease
MKLMREHLERLLLYNQDAPLKERWIMLGTAKGHIVGAHPGSFLLGGHSGMGKSHLLAYLCCMAVLASGRLLVIDPHCHEREEGLFHKIEPLRPWFIRQPVDFEDIDEVLALFLWLEQEYWNRKKIGGMRGKLPLYIIIDEFNELLSLFDPKQVKVIARIIGNLARGGRKFGMYLIVCAHNWNLAASGGSDVRKNIAGGRIAVGCEPADAAMMLSVDIAEVKPFFSPPLRKGDALIKPAEQRVQRVHFPLNGREHCQGVAEFVAEMIGLPEESLALPEAVTRTADTTANHADTASGVIRSIEDYRLPAHTPTWGQEPDNRGNQGNRKRKQVTQETLDAMVSWRMKGESHRKIRKRVKLEGKYYEELYVPACQQLGLELDPDAPMNPQEWALMKQHYHWTCLACGRREPEIELHPDHIIPRSKGGSDALRNRQPLCKSCNSSKNDSTIDYRKQ